MFLWGKYNRVRDFEDLPLETSHSALRAVKMPQNFLDGAIVVFLVGFGLYELFLWVEDGAEDDVAYRNIWIVGKQHGDFPCNEHTRQTGRAYQ